MKQITMGHLTRLINKEQAESDCSKCLWAKNCEVINNRCSVATTIKLLSKGGYLGIKECKAKKSDRRCESCKHYRWFAEYAMVVCEKRGEKNMLDVCSDYEERGGEE